MAVQVEARTSPQEGEVRQGLLVGAEPYRPLHPDPGLAPVLPLLEDLGEPIHALLMAATDRGHVDDDSIDQLHARVRAEGSRLREPVVFLRGEPVTHEGQRHAVLRKAV